MWMTAQAQNRLSVHVDPGSYKTSQLLKVYQEMGKNGIDKTWKMIKESGQETVDFFGNLLENKNDRRE